MPHTGRLRSNIAAVLVLVLLLCAGSAAFAADESRADSDYRYIRTEEGAIITKYLREGVADVVVPSTIDGHPVIGIGDYAFALRQTEPESGYEYCEIRLDIQSVTLPEGIRTIGEGAFESLEALMAIDLPESLTELGRNAFRWCTALTSVHLPSGLREIPESAFESCGLTTLSIPEGVTSIGPSAFVQNRGLLTVSLPESLESIGDAAFGVCSSLTSIELPENLSSLGTAALHATGLRQCTIPERIVNVPAALFMYCENLTEVRFDGLPARIMQNVFMECPSLETIEVEATQEEWIQVAVDPEGNEAYYNARIVYLRDGPTPTSQPISGAPDLPGGISIRPDSPLTVTHIEGYWQAFGYTAQSADGALTEETLVEQFEVPDGVSITVVREENDLRDSEGTIVATGDRIVFEKDGEVLSEVTVVVHGDVLGTGVMTLSQLVRLSHALSGDMPLEGDFLAAADFTATGEITLSDLVMQASLLRGPR